MACGANQHLKKTHRPEGVGLFTGGLLKKTEQAHSPSEMTTKSILCVEDGQDDILLLRLALKAAKVECHLEIVPDIETAQAYLGGQREYSDRARYPWPSLVLSDLTLPGGSGLQLVEWIRRQHSREVLPVIIMTGSADEEAWKRAQAAGADYCVPKSAGFQEAVEKIRVLLDG